MLKNGRKYIEKCNSYIKYFDKIKCYADRPYLVFSELKPETHIYFLLALIKTSKQKHGYISQENTALLGYFSKHPTCMCLAEKSNSSKMREKKKKGCRNDTHFHLGLFRGKNAIFLTRRILFSRLKI